VREQGAGFQRDVERLRRRAALLHGLQTFYIVGPTALQIGCVFLGVAGLVWYFDREIKKREANITLNAIVAGAPKR